jgi:predicted GH43/DUF377 family glycosyl hydrolase
MKTILQLAIIISCLLPGNVQSQLLSFTKQPADTFVLGAGKANLPITCHDPALYEDAEGYHLFFTSYFCQKNGTWFYSWDPANPGDCDISDAIQTLGYAFSNDKGLTWKVRETPLLVPGPEDWDKDAVETASVILKNDTLCLFYSASGYKNGSLFSERYQIGMARLSISGRTIKQALLTDGDRFTKQTTPFIPFDTQTSSLQNNVQEPGILLKDNRFELYYIGLKLSIPDAGFDEGGQEITSIKLLRQKYDPNFNPIGNSEVCQIPHNVNMTEVKFFNTEYYLFYTTTEPGNFHEDEKIGYSTSADGINWEQGTIILQKDAGHPYENWGVMAPTVTLDADSVYLFYTAWGTEGHACFPVSATGRFGLPLSANQCVYGTMARAVASALPIVSLSPGIPYDKYSIQVFPNPSGGMITLSTIENIKDITLLDLLGHSENLTIQKEIQLENLISGIYFLKITMSNGLVITKKISLQKE